MDNNTKFIDLFLNKQIKLPLHSDHKHYGKIIDITDNGCVIEITKVFQDTEHWYGGSYSTGDIAFFSFHDLSGMKIINEIPNPGHGYKEH